MNNLCESLKEPLYMGQQHGEGFSGNHKEETVDIVWKRF